MKGDIAVDFIAQVEPRGMHGDQLQPTKDKEGQNSKARDHVTVRDDSEDETYPRDLSHNVSYGVSQDSHVNRDWMAQLESSLPQTIDTPCKLTLGLNVDSSPDTFAKLTYLLDYLESEYFFQQIQGF